MSLFCKRKRVLRRQKLRKPEAEKLVSDVVQAARNEGLRES